MLSDKLPIYLETWKLLNIVLDITVNFSKFMKFSVGEELVKYTIELFENIHKANTIIINSPEDKEKRIECLSSFLDKFETIKLLIRVCSERGEIGIKKTAEIAIITESIGRQATAWKNK